MAHGPALIGALPSLGPSLLTQGAEAVGAAPSLIQEGATHAAVLEAQQQQAKLQTTLALLKLGAVQPPHQAEGLEDTRKATSTPLETMPDS